MTSDSLKVSAIKFGSYKITIGENAKGKPIASLYRLLSAGPFKGQYRTMEGYYFKSEERRAEWVKEKMETAKGWENRKKENANKKKAARENMEHGFEVGQILYDSWGYDQTNIDFYQIIQVKEKSVVIQSIGGESVDGTYGHDSCNVRPVKDSFHGAPMQKIIQVSVYGEKARYYIKSRHGSIGIYDGGEKGVYSSWGH